MSKDSAACRVICFLLFWAWVLWNNGCKHAWFQSNKCWNHSVCVCVHACECVCVHACAWVCVCMCTCMCVSVCLRACEHVHYWFVITTPNEMQKLYAGETEDISITGESPVRYSCDSCQNLCLKRFTCVCLCVTALWHSTPSQTLLSVPSAVSIKERKQTSCLYIWPKSLWYFILWIWLQDIWQEGSKN